MRDLATRPASVAAGESTSSAPHRARGGPGREDTHTAEVEATHGRPIPRLAPSVILALVVAGVFSPVLGHGFVNWDDGQHVYANPVVTDPWSRPWWEHLTTPGVGYPTPLPTLVHRLAWGLGGGAALPFHATSMLVHMAIAALLFRAMVLRGVSPWMALTGTLAFAVHPITVEPVAWATGLKDLGVGLGIACLLGSPAVSAGGERPRDAGEDGSRTRMRPAIGAWLLGVTSKPTAGLLGAGFAVRAWIDERPRRAVEATPRRPPRILWLVLAGLTTAVGVALLWFARTHQPDAIRTTLDTPWTASRPLAALGITAEHLVAPIALSPVTPASSATSLHVLAGVLVGVGFAAAAAYFAQRRDERAYWLALAFLAWLPVSNVVPLVRFTADSYAYVPWLLICATATSTAHELAASPLGQALSASTRRAVSVGIAVWVVMLAGLSALQVRVWRDDVTLWTAAVDAHPDQGELVVRLGDALGRAGDVRGELALYVAHEDALARHGAVPPALLAFLRARGDDDALSRWFAIGLAAEVTQSETFYGYYAAHVVRTAAPERTIDRAAITRGLPLVEAAPAAYGLADPAHRAALQRWHSLLAPREDSPRTDP